MQTVNEGVVIEMDQSRSSKIFLAVFFLAIILSLAVSYWRIVVKRDYDVIASVDCDPYEERCFVHVCNPDPDVDGECAGDPVEDTWFTKTLNRKAYNIPECDPMDETCTALQCGEDEEGCFYELCGEANMPEGDNCNDPEQYTKDNPVEEAIECEEGDEECVIEAEGDAAACTEGDEECVMEEEGDAATCAEGDVECAAANDEAGSEAEVTICEEGDVECNS